MSTTVSPTGFSSAGDVSGGSDEGLSTPEGGSSPRRELSPSETSAGVAVDDGKRGGCGGSRTNGVDGGGRGGSGGGSNLISDFDLETLDESEFDLPPVATPTLQSILDELQNDVDEFEIG